MPHPACSHSPHRICPRGTGVHHRLHHPPLSPAPMKFVALISGGKDSFFNILHCMQNGHELVALANLHPADESINETDSFMFQTVGHDVIDFYRQCVPEIPIYRKALAGGSSNVNLEYVPTAQDEIEDLFALLQEVQEHHPDVAGVSCGAILSHYQRTRVENVCDRLSLTLLAYLWQRDQAELMGEICALGLDARLIKVAAIGLTEKHLGKPLAQMYPVLLKLNQMYDVHVCGEGGEFETLVFDAPFFSRKLAIQELAPVTHSSDSLYLTMKIAVEEKDGRQPFTVPVPSLLQEEFAQIASTVEDVANTETAEVIANAEALVSSSAAYLAPRVCQLSSRTYISNLVSTKESVEDQTEDALARLLVLLSERALLLADIQHTSVLVRDLANFDRVNRAYAKFFHGIHLPPSRVCVETVLPAPYQIQISCVVLKPEGPKTGIHIRSRSYWAPQNIGPYSQAIVECRKTFKTATLSGQIPLIPASMELLGNSNAKNALLALQHLHRAKCLVGVKQVAECVCFITKEMSPQLVARVWRQYVDEVEGDQSFYDKLTIVQVQNLPRNASVEWGGLVFEKVRDMYEDDTETGTGSTGYEELVKNFKSSVAAVGDEHVVCLATSDMSAVADLLRHAATQTSFVRVMATLEDIHKLADMGLTAEWVPVLGVWNSEGEACSFGILLIG